MSALHDSVNCAQIFFDARLLARRGLMASSIGERIRELRTTLRLTQDQFGNKIGVKNGVVSAWEKGSAPVPDGRVRIIRDEYNASIDWILKGEGEMFQESTEDPNAKRDAALEYALSLIRKLPAVERNDAVEFIRELVRRCDDDYVSALRKPSSKNAQSDVPEIVIASADDDFNRSGLYCNTIEESPNSTTRVVTLAR